MTDDEVSRIRALGAAPLIYIPTPPRYSRDAVSMTATDKLELSARFAGEPPLVVREVPKPRPLPEPWSAPSWLWYPGQRYLYPRDRAPDLVADKLDEAYKRYPHPSDKRGKP